MIQQNQSLHVPKHVDFQRVEGEVVLIDLQRGSYYGLDTMSSLIWESIANAGQRQAAIDAVLSGYEAQTEVVRHDVDQLVDRWLELGLMASTSSSGENAASSA